MNIFAQSQGANDPDIILNQAWNLCKIEEYDKAIQSLAPLLNNKVAGHWDSYLEALYLRGICYYMQKDYHKAIADFNALREHNVSYENILSLRGDCYSLTEQWEKAIVDYSEYLESDPEDIIAILISRAQVYHELKQFSRAVADYSQALSIENNNKDIYLYRAQSLFKLGNYLGAFSDLIWYTELYKLGIFIICIYLAGFFISLVRIKTIFNMVNISDEEKYFSYNRYRAFVTMPFFFLIIFLVRTLNLDRELFNFLSVLFPNNIVCIYISFAIISSLLLYGFIFFQNTIPTYYIQKRLRKTEVKFLRYAKISSTFFIFLLLFQMIFFFHSLLLELINLKGILEIIVSILLFSMLLAVIIIFYPYLIALFYGRLADEGEKLFMSYVRTIKKWGLGLKKIVVVKTSDLKMANAWVAGLGLRQIFITDYLIENFKKPEIKLILAHEVGHIKKGHRWIYFSFILFWFFSSYLFTYFLSEHYYITLVYTLFCFLILFRFISRKLEFAADRFAVENCSKPQTLISVLKKLAKLNTSALRLKRSEEKVSTHPSIERRIKYIKQIIEEQA